MGISVIDFKPTNSAVIDYKPRMSARFGTLTERTWPVVLNAFQPMGLLLSLTYPVNSGTVNSPITA